MTTSINLEEKEKTPHQTILIPIYLKHELDKLKIVERETYSSVIKKLIEEHNKIRKKEK